MTEASRPPQHPADVADDEIDLRALFGTLAEGKGRIALFMLIAGIFGLVYVLIAPPIYQANAIVQVEQKKGGIAGLGDMGELLGTPSEAVTEIQLIKSRAVIGGAVDRLKLDIEAKPLHFPLIGQAFARRFLPTPAQPLAEPPYGLSSHAWGGERISVERLQVPPLWEGKPLLLQLTDDQHFVLLDTQHHPLLQGSVGESLDQGGFKLLVSDLAGRPGSRFELTKHNRVQTILDYQDDLKALEKGKDSGIIELALESTDVDKAVATINAIAQIYVRQNVERTSAEAAQSLEFLKQQLPEIRKQLEDSEQRMNKFQSSTRTVDISLETKAVLDQLVEFDTRLSELQLKRAEMDRKYTPEHPAYRALLQQTRELEADKAQLSGKIQGLPETQQELLRLQRDVEVTTQIYTQLLNKIQELDIVRAGAVGNVRLIDPAVVAPEPVMPKPALTIVLAIILGLMTGIGFVLARASMNRGVISAEQLENIGLPVYATVPLSEDQSKLVKRLRLRRLQAQQQSLVLAKRNPADLAIESLRGLRTSLHFAMLDAGNNILMISGPSPEVGKSFVSTNLAALIAESGQKVLLIDADMRKGHIHGFFRLDEKQGLSELIAAEITPEQAIHATEIENLHFIARGRVPPNPAELLMNPRFEAFLKKASEMYDLVLIDTPPILAVTDAAIIGKLAGTAMIVTRFAQNPIKEIEATLRRFEQNGIVIKGAILNAVERRAARYYGYEGYDYYQYEYKSGK
ncbi:MAG: polysaccharide biosynthesis tyrosine autokinase [Pseudomonadota bacterium]